MSITFSNLVTQQAAWNLSAANARLGESILRLSSGLKVQYPQDGTFEYIRASSLQHNVRLYEGVRSNLSEYRSILSLANDAGAEIRKKLETMREKAIAASDPTMGASERSALFTEFNTLRDTIDKIVKSTKYEGGGILYEAGKYNQVNNISVIPDRSVTMTLDLDKMDVSDSGVDGIVIDDTAWPSDIEAGTSSVEVSTAINTVDTFMAEVSGSLEQVQGHIRMADSMIQNFSAARSSLIEIDVAEEMANFTSLDVKKQAAQAVFAQANLSQRSILRLYEFSYSG
ncbi:MAG: flagellin [Fibrobacterota bacterium]